MRILIAEDDPVSRRILQDILEDWQYEVVATSNGNEAWEVLQHEKPPLLAILDWMMPGMSGVEICRRLRDSKKESYVYVLILTAKHEKQDIILAMDAGADDYVSKPFDDQELRVRLRAGQRIVELQETLRFQAAHDVLTGVWNRGMIIDILKRELDRSGRQNEPFGVIMADLDHFKDVNDTYGHQAGDEVLCEACRRMSGSLRSYDSLGRYGGEEFLIVLPGCNTSSILEVAERIRSRVASTPVATLEGQISITVSLGAAVQSGDCHGPGAVTKAADDALYKAKANGRNCVELSILECDLSKSDNE